MRLGVVGTGGIVTEFLPIFSKMDNIELVGVVSSPRSIGKAEEIKEQYGMKIATSSIADLEKEVDVVYLGVPNHLHYEYALKAIEMGMNVIVEKPLCSNGEEAEKLIQKAKEKHVFLFEAVSTLYLESFEKMEEWLPSIGEIKEVKCEFNQHSRRYDAFERGEVLPAFDPACSGGALMDLNIYNLHLVYGLFGKPEAIDYEAEVVKGIDVGGILKLKYPSFVATCTASKTHSGAMGVQIIGSEGCIIAQWPANVIGPVKRSLKTTEEEFAGGDPRLRMVPELERFFKAIAENDYEFCEEMMEESLNVMKLQTEARIKANVVFPADHKA